MNDLNYSDIEYEMARKSVIDKISAEQQRIHQIGPIPGHDYSVDCQAFIETLTPLERHIIGVNP